MDFIPLVFKIAVVAAAALLLGWVYLSYYRRDRTRTRHMLDGFLGVLSEPHTGISPWGYEFVEGLLDGRPIKVSLFPDSLITRTLPTLWLEARWASSHEAWLCVIAQRNGMEYFSDDVDEGTHLVLHNHWPGAVVARGKGPQSTALARRLRPLDLHFYPDFKMLTLSETETKVIMRCARGDVPIYRVMRSADFPGDSVKPELVQETLRVLRDIEHTLEAGEEEVA
jgi:hypothetical protein